MKVREVSIKDYNKIKKLFKRNHLKMINLNKWKNLWNKNPILLNKKKWIKGWVLESNKNEVVGHIGNFPMQYFLNKKSYLCSVLNGWVVDKKFRSISMLLIRKYFSQKNVDFFLGTSFGFTTSKIMQAMNGKAVPTVDLDTSLIIILKSISIPKYFFGKVSFPFKSIVLKLLSLILVFFLKGRFNFWKNNFSNENITKCSSFDNRFNIMWKKIKLKKKNKLLFNRDKNWLRWHLDHLLKTNKAWIFVNIKNNKTMGYSICIEKENLENKIKSALLVDLITLDDNSNMSRNLIGANIKEAKKRNCDIFELRGFDKQNREYMEFFKPFKKKLSLNSFYYKSRNRKLDKLLNNVSCWNPTYIDGDAIINL